MTMETTIPVKGSDKLNIADLSVSSIDNYRIRPIDTFPFMPLSLRGMMHAYFAKDGDNGDRFLNPDYRKSVKDTESRGERSSSYLQFNEGKTDRANLFHNVEGLAYTKNGIVVLGGERIGEVYVPDDNWILGIDFEQGWVTKTGTYEQAKEIFGDDASFLSVNRAGIRNVSRFHGWDRLDRYGPFDVDVPDGPVGRDDCVGVRLASRPEPVRSTGDAGESQLESYYRKASDFHRAMIEGNLSPNEIKKRAEELDTSYTHVPKPNNV